MAWMLQPHSYSQVIRPNLYNVAYRRVGAYKGMGRDVSIGPAYYPNAVPQRWGIFRRGLGQDSTDALSNMPISTPTSIAMSNLETAGAAQQIQTQLNQQNMNNLLPWILGGFLFIALIAKK